MVEKLRFSDSVERFAGRGFAPLSQFFTKLYKKAENYGSARPIDATFLDCQRSINDNGSMPDNL
jgi:hypothetical protein